MIKAVSFDFDGTLVDSNQIKKDAFVCVVKEWGLSAEEMTSLVERTQGDRTVIFSAVVDFLVDQNRLSSPMDRQQTINRLIQSYTDICESEISKAPEIDGASECLKMLQNLNLPLYVVSATPEVTLNTILTNRKMKFFFQGIYGEFGKKSDHISRIMAGLKIKPQEHLYVGDQRVDWEAANQVNCPFVFVGKEDSFMKQKNIPIISNLTELIPLLDHV